MCSKLVTSCLFVSLVLRVYASTEPDPYLIQRKCSTVEDTLYAVDEHQCYLFRNPCIYANDVCQRREKKEIDLTIVSRDDCDKKCRDFCTDEYKPVCAEFNNTLETFPNKCEFHRISCQNNKFTMVHVYKPKQQVKLKWEYTKLIFRKTYTRLMIEQ